MVIHKFVKPELDFYREQCNFVGAEREVFELRSQKVSLEDIAERLGYTVDGINKISRDVNEKINRINTVLGQN